MSNKEYICVWRKPIIKRKFTKKWKKNQLCKIFFPHALSTLFNLSFRSDNPFDTRLEVAPVSRINKVIKHLNEDGFEDGPDPSQIVGVCEGDIIEINFRGNIQNNSSVKCPKFVYNSNLPSSTEFFLSEVDQYLQRNFHVFRGVVEVYRVQYVVPDKKTVARKESVLDENSFCVRKEKKKILICEIPITIPKVYYDFTQEWAYSYKEYGY